MDTASRAGERVTHHVRLVEPLAEGSMGSVWLAEHLNLQTRVAVKFISAARGAKDPEMVARFEREARAAARIKSHHVVQIFDYGVTDAGTPYMVLELLEGETLEARLAREGLPVRDTATMVTHVGRALTKAHELGIVHRDIKPANVFLTSAEEGLFCKVLDFGVAKQLSRRPGPEGEVTLDGMLVGTPQYMSPEQMLGGEIDHRADLWALAVVAYQCLTRRLPFPHESLEALSTALFRGTWSPPSTVCDHLPPALDAWFARAFQKKPDDRFASADEMVTAFRAALPATADEVVAPPPSTPPAMPETLSGATTRRLAIMRSQWLGKRRLVGAAATLAMGVALTVLLLTPPEPSPEAPASEGRDAEQAAPTAVVSSVTTAEVDAGAEVEQARPQRARARPAAPAPRASASSKPDAAAPSALPPRELGF